VSIAKHIVAAGALVHNERGQFLLVRHPERGWEIPGGYVNTGEDLINALQREVKEETGIDIVVGRLAGIHQNVQVESSEIPTKVIFDFLASRQGGILRTSHEHLEAIWVSRDDVLKMVTHPVFRDRIEHMLDFPGKVLLRIYSKTPYTIHGEVYL